MFRSYWLPAIALGLVCFCLLASKQEAKADAEKPNEEAYSYSTNSGDLWVLPNAGPFKSAFIPVQEQSQPHYPEIESTAAASYEKADLHEQRRMAKAAEDAVWWSKFQSGLGALGFGAVLASLGFAGWAAKAARDQVKLSRHALVDTDRAFVFPCDNVWVCQKDAMTDEIKNWAVIVKWHNSGKTPTRHLRTHFNLALVPNLFPENFDFPDYGERSIPILIAPGGQQDSITIQVALKDLDAVSSGTLHLYTWGWVEYDDVFENTHRHRTEFCYKWSIGGNPRTSDRFTASSSVYHQYNGADEECLGPLRTTSPKHI